MQSDQPPDDTRLMVLVRDKDDEAAFEQLFERHRNKTLLFFKLKTSYSEEAQDLTQQVWLRIWRYRRSFKDGCIFLPWHWGIAFNILREWATHRKLLTDSLDERNSPAVAVENVTDFALAVRKAWEQLTPEHREVLQHLYA